MNWHIRLISCAFIAGLGNPAAAHQRHTHHAASRDLHATRRAPTYHAMTFVRQPVGSDVGQVPTPAFRALDDIPADSIIPAIQRERGAQHDQVLCLALALYHEQRAIDEETDRQGVAHVIYNRAKQTELSVCATVWARHGSQFQWVKNVAAITPREIDAWGIIQADAVNFAKHRPRDFTHGATYFYNPTLCTPPWLAFGVVTAHYQHVFVRMQPKS